MYEVSKYKLRCLSVKEKSKITAWRIRLPCRRKPGCNKGKKTQRNAENLLGAIITPNGVGHRVHAYMQTAEWKTVPAWMSLKHKALTGCLFMCSKILGREGRLDGASSNEDIRFCATAKRTSRLLRWTPNSQCPIKNIRCDLGTQIPVDLPSWLPRKWRHPGVSCTCFPASLCNCTSVLHLPPSHHFMPISDWNKLVQERS